MKTNLKHIGKKSLSVLIALVIVMSTMLVGIVTVNAASISYWTVSGWQTNGGLASVNWSASDVTYKISGASGSVTYTNIKDDGATNTESIYFRMLAHMSDSSKNVSTIGNKGTQTTLTDGVKSAALTWTTCPSDYTKVDSIGGELVFKPTKKYVTFTISQSGSNNYVTVTESDTKPGETTVSDFYIGGRFKAKDASGNDVDCYTGTTYEWDAKSTKFKFTATETENLYKFETNSTLTDLSRQSANHQDPYFLIHTGKGDDAGNTWYGGTGKNLHNFQNMTESSPAILSKYTDANNTDRLIKFSAKTDDPAGKVTLYLDVTNADRPKMYYKTNSDEPAPVKHSITTDTNPNAMINYTSSVAAAGETINVKITTKNNYTCSDIQVNGVSQTVTATDNVYTCSFTMPDEDVKITYTLVAPEISMTGVTLTTSVPIVLPGETFTLTATPAPSDAMVDKYEFFVTNDLTTANGTSLGAAAKSSISRVTAPETAGEYGYYVVATDTKGNTFTSNVVVVDVQDGNPDHNVTVYFKSSSSYVYVPSVSVDGGEFVQMTRSDELGRTASGAITFYWYSYKLEHVDSTKNHTLVFKTRATDVNASVTAKLVNDKSYFAVDNLMDSSTAVNISNEPEYIRNYHNTAVNMLAPANPDTGTLGYTTVGGQRYKMGTYIEENPSSSNRVSIKSATLVQKSLVKLAAPSELQSQLLDVDMNGRMSIKDATLIQKALVH